MLELSYHFKESATTLFDAWLAKPVVELWLFKNDTNELEFTSDGKTFSVKEKDGDKQIDHFGTYLKADRPGLLQFTLEVPDHFEGVSEVTIQIKETRAGTKLTFTQKNIDTSKTKAAWEMMIGRLTRLLQTPYTVSIQSGGEEVIQALLVVAMQIVGMANYYDEEAWNKVPYKGSWTVGQLIRHVQKSVEGAGEMLMHPTEKTDRDPGELILALKQSFLDITRNLDAPEFIIPEVRHYEKERLINEFEATLAPLAHVKNVQWNELIKGLPFGDVTKLEIIHFMLYHLQRHLIQMRRITEALKPPLASPV